LHLTRLRLAGEHLFVRPEQEIVHQRTFDWTNDTGEGVELVYEPDGMPIDIGPGAALHLVCSGIEEGELEVDHKEDALVVYGWPSSKAEVFVDGVLVYSSPVAMPSLPPHTSTKEFVVGLFGGSTDPTDE
jgi:hypothetical protein